MLAIDFPGSRRLIDTLDCAVRKECQTTITDALRLGLCRLMQSGEIELPECVYQAAADHYARRELYNSEELGYSVMAMTWGPGQGTLIHDHCGMW
ncbi:MAG: cysteine dioxygenase, partial [Dokdonella sp.]